MKNQNDLIISIVAVVLALIIGGVAYGMKRVPVAPAAPEVVVVTPPAMPSSEVKMANALPGASANSGGFGQAGPGMGGPGVPGDVPAGPRRARAQ